MTFLSANGAVLHYHYHYHKAAEEAPCVVFANSLGTDFRIWDEVRTHLDDNISTLVYDKRGHGLSSLPERFETLTLLVDDIAALMDRLEIKQAIICGLSIGGLIAFGLASLRPDLCQGLIICDSAPKIGTQALWAERIAKVHCEGLESIADTILKRWFSPSFFKARPDDLIGYHAMLTRTPRDGYISCCRAISQSDFSPSLASLSLPMHFVVGADDVTTTPSLVKEAATLAKSPCTTLAEVGHLPPIEAPEALADIITNFITQRCQ